MTTIAKDHTSLQARVPDSLAKRVRLAATGQGVPPRDIVIAAIEEYFQNHPEQDVATSGLQKKAS